VDIPHFEMRTDADALDLSAIEQGAVGILNRTART